ncbi:MAG: hypothetical protein F4Z63_06110 [Gammaproteobacteria bacterium]|nr:hypothetical protein [Gammaproteobacteria bacterium]MYJ19266.1 hypothetical protein [Rhodothermaceae bacterium]
MHTELHRGPSKVLNKRTFVRLLFVAFSLIVFSVQPSHAQSGVGVGLVFSTPHAGGVSVRYKPIQVIVDANISGGVNTDVILSHLAIRYNHPVRDLDKVKFKVFGQIGRHKFPEPEQGPAIPTLYQFTGGGSAELRIGRRSSSKGLFLTLDLGLSIDHKGNLGAFPARGIALHFFF